MKMKSGTTIFIAAFTISVIFLGSVFVNLNIKKQKNELEQIYKEIELIKKDIKRQKIEITTLTNPDYILDYAEKKGYSSVPVKDIIQIDIKEEK